MRVVVTGGAGFIGSHIVDALVSQGDEVHVLDNLSTGKALNVDPRADLQQLDVASHAAADFVRQIRPDAVCHQAGIASVAQSVANPMEDARVNLIGSLGLIVAAAEIGARFVFASSAAVYAEPRRLPIKESDATEPASPYGAAKLAVERYLAVYARLHGMPGAALRYANVYGPRQRSDGEGGVVAIFCAAGASGQPLVIHGHGQQTRDFIYVTDVAEANLRALALRSTGVFNVSTGMQTSITQLAHSVHARVSPPVGLVHGPARAGDLKHSALDPGQAHEWLAWKPRISLEAGLAQTFKWFQASPGPSVTGSSAVRAVGHLTQPSNAAAVAS